MCCPLLSSPLFTFFRNCFPAEIFSSALLQVFQTSPRVIPNRGRCTLHGACAPFTPDASITVETHLVEVTRPALRSLLSRGSSPSFLVLSTPKREHHPPYLLFSVFKSPVYLISRPWAQSPTPPSPREILFSFKLTESFLCSSLFYQFFFDI